MLDIQTYLAREGLAADAEVIMRRGGWVKAGGGGEKVFWTGSTWDCFWGGYSPEARVDTPVPPLSGYNEDRGGCDIKVRYQRVGRSMGCCASTAA